MITKHNQQQKTLKLLEGISGEKLTLGRLLWAIRMGEEISQVNFAKQLGVSKQYLCDLERGRKFVSPKAAASYAKVLGYPVTQFVRLGLQDMVDKEGMNLVIEVKVA